MNGRGFYSWYTGELARDGSPAAHQVPGSLLNFPGNALGLLHQNPMQQPQSPVGALTGNLTNFYLNQLSPRHDQTPVYGMTPPTAYLPHLLPLLGNGVTQ